jgi:AcrR family transcriptional regulator
MTATTRSGPVRSETARLAILTSTAKLFAADGYEELTISGIAADAGGTPRARSWPSACSRA